MGSPLVSIMVVAHDAEQSLGLALASVLSQTIGDWECIVVDDGSTKPASTIVESLRDGRFQYVRLAENRGRGYARQRALDAAKGRLLAVLDADDWMYPTRLEAELDCLSSTPQAKLVGCSMVIEDLRHDIVGVQEAGIPGSRRLGHLPLSFAPMLADLELARRIGFDERLTRSEDVLFLNRALDVPWARVPAPLYAYRPSTATRKSALEGYRCCRLAYSQCRRSHPFAARRFELAYRVRELVHGLSPEPVRRRMVAWSRARVLRSPTVAERLAHDRARQTVIQVAQSQGVVAGTSNAEGAPT